MMLLTKAHRTKMLANGRKKAADPEAPFDPKPVVKLFSPVGSATWLLTELDPHDQDTAFGLCDLGMGYPELGYVSISELASIRIRPFGLGIERDRFFTADKTLSEYTAEARRHQGIQA